MLPRFCFLPRHHENETDKMASSRMALALRRSSLFPSFSLQSELLISERYGTGGPFSVHERCFHRTAVTLKKKKKSEWRMFRMPCNTELRHDKDEWVKERRTFGGGRKAKAIWKNKGSYTLQSMELELEVPILDVVHSEANQNHVIKKIMAKGTIVQIDGTAFSSSLQKRKSSSIKLDSTDIETENQHNTFSKDDQLLSKMIEDGKLFAKITTRPGQDGLCNGYILEGTELEHMMEKLSLIESPRR